MGNLIEVFYLSSIFVMAIFFLGKSKKRTHVLVPLLVEANLNNNKTYSGKFNGGYSTGGW